MLNDIKNTQEPHENSASQETEPHVVFYDSYDHGFTNGLLKIPKEHFETFIHENGQKRLANIGLASTLQGINQLNVQQVQTRERLLQLKNLVAASEHEIELEKERKSELKIQFEKAKFAHIQTQDARNNLIIDYNWLNVAIFLAVGIMFVLADYTITLDVLQNGLDMVYSRAVALAIAVSGITFVFKPTIDRLFEKPYLRDDKSKKHGLLITVSVLALIVLGFLGYFREAYFQSSQLTNKYEQEIKRNDEEISRLQADNRSNVRQGHTTDVRQSDATIKELESNNKDTRSKIEENIRAVSSNKALYVVFILSNILFAVAGAICLSIAFPAADRLRRKRLLRKQQKSLEQVLKMIEENNNLCSIRSKDHQIARDQALNEIQLLPDLNTLEAERQALLTKLELIRKESAVHRAQAESAIYKEAYERGNVCEFGDKLIFSANQVTTALRRGNSGTVKRPGRPVSDSQASQINPLEDFKESENTDRYLHQQIRSLIEYNHRRKKHLLNGEVD